MSGVSTQRRPLLPLLAFLGLGLVWEALCVWGGWSVEALPTPRQTVASTWELIQSGDLLRHAVASLYRVTAGFYLAVLFGIPAGMLLGWWKAGQAAFSPVIEFLRPISPLAWIPLAMLWFGIGDQPAIFLIFLASFFTILVPTTAAVNDISRTYFQVASNLDFSKLELFRLVIFPAILPRLLPALRISVGIAWLVVVAAEMIAVKSGLGFLILDARNALRMDFVVSAMISIGLIGIGLDWVIGRLGRIESVAWGMQHH